MSLMIFNAKEQYLAADKRFRYVDEMYPVDCISKIYLNESNTVAYSVIGALLTLESMELLDLHFKKFYFSNRDKQDLESFQKEIKNILSVDTNLEETPTILIMTRDSLYYIDESKKMVELLNVLNIAFGTGNMAARVCTIANVNDPVKIFKIASLSVTSVSDTFDIVYRKNLKPINVNKKVSDE